MPPPSLKGNFDGRHYANPHFGIEMTIPDAWDLRTEGVGQLVAKQADERMPHMKRDLAAVRPRLDYEWKALRRSEAEPGEPWLQITLLIHRGGKTSGIRDSEGYARNYVRDIKRGARAFEEVDPVKSVKVSGVEFSRVRYFVTVGEISIYQSAYFRLVGEDVVVISAAYGTDAHVKILESVIGEE